MKSVNKNTRAGTLCRCDQYFLMLFPTAERAAFAERTEITHIPVKNGLEKARNWADYLARNAKCDVVVVSPDDCFMIIDWEQDCLKILTGNHVGWLSWARWLKMYEAYRR